MFAKCLIAYFPQISLFIIINTNKNDTIICQQVLCQLQSRINHIKPIGMETAVALGVLHHTIAIFIVLSTVSKVLIHVLSKVVLIHKIVTRVVRRINVNHLDFTKIGFLQQLQHFKVVTLNIEVFGGIKVHAASAAIRFSLTVCPGGNCFIFTNRTQRLVDGCIGKQNGLFLVRPSELIAFLVTVHDLTGNLLHQHILINRTNDFAIFIDRFRYGIGKHRRQLLEILISLVRCLHSQFVHNCPPSFVFSISR